MSVTVPADSTPAQRIDTAALWVVEHVPALLVALVLLPVIIAGGSYLPYLPNTVDLEVYWYAVADMLAGRDIYQTVTPVMELWFIYPPIAAVLMAPLALFSYGLWQIIWTAGLVVAQQSVLRRAGVRRGWWLALFGAAAVLVVEPIRSTLGYGQVNTLLMAMVVVDLLPDHPRVTRRWPRGLLIGLAAAIKLTPLLFVLFALLIGCRRLAAVASATFAVFTAVGFLVLPKESFHFWSQLADGQMNTTSPIYVGNQAISGVVARLVGTGSTMALVGIGIGLVLAAIAALVGAVWWRRGHQVFAVSLVGLATCLGAPLAWTHHYVWVLPMLVCVAGSRRIPRWVRVWSMAWCLWVSMSPMLMFLPYGGGPELRYGFLDDLVGSLGPLAGSALIVALAVHALTRPAPSPPAVQAPATPDHASAPASR